REQQIIEALTGRYDEVEALWNEAEQDLKRFRVPHAVEHCYRSDYDNGVPTHYLLGWMRYGKDWRICRGVRLAYSEFEERPDEDDWTPVVDSSLEARLSLMDEFERLRSKVVEEAEKAIPKLDDAIAKFRRILKG